jgi:TonB family protein
MRRLTIAAALSIVFAAGTASAQPDGDTPPDGGEPAEPAITKLPEIKTMVEAVYPAQALTDRVAASVVLEIDIDAEGFVEAASVVSSTFSREDGTPAPDTDTYGFEEAATVAVTQIEFTPAEAEGVPIPVRINYTYHFKLPEPDPVVPDIPDNPDEPPAPDVPVAPVKDPVVNFKGVLLERGSRARLAGITVTVYRGEGDAAEGYEAISDENGEFVLFDLAADEWNILIAPDGYYDYKTTETVTVNELVEVKYYVEKKSNNPYDVVVEADRPKKEVNRRTLDREEILKVPGTLGDPVLVVENLPGVARPTVGTGFIIVRGSGPEDTGIFVDGTNVPLIYHFGGLKSIVPATVVDSIDFYPGNYSVEYGRAMGGIFDLHLKRLEPDRIHGSVDVSVLDTSLYLEVPIGEKAAVAVAGRRSYIDFVLDAVIPDDADVALINAPRYWDFQLMGNYRPNDDHEFRAAFIASDDIFELLFDDPAEISAGLGGNDISTSTEFQRLMLEHRYVPSEKFRYDGKLSFGRDIVDFSFFDTFRFDFNVRSLELREKVTYVASDRVTLSAGLDAQGYLLSGEVKAPRPPDEGEPPPEFDPDDVVFSAFDNRGFWFAAPWVEARVKLGDAELVPGLRADYFAYTGEYSVDPRIVGRYDFGDITAKAGVAVVHQEATPQETDDVFGNPDLELQRALQYSVGAEWRPRDQIKLDVTLFYKDLQNQTSRTGATTERDGEQVPLVYDNNGEGRVYGAEVFLEHKFNNNFRGWLSYTLSRAERLDSGETDWRLFDFDQTHILAIVASYLLPRNWEVGLRWRLVSGNPDTPVVGATFVDESDSYAPMFGEINSDRLPMFQQLDLRVDKTWVFDTWKLAAYLSVINTTNHDNVEAINYNYDFTETETINGLPILPILGVKGEW